MTSAHKVLATLALMSLCFSAQGQSGITENNRFSADGLTFEYPKAWSITDEGTTENQQIKLTLPGNSVQLIVIARRNFTLQKGLIRPR